MKKFKCHLNIPIDCKYWLLSISEIWLTRKYIKWIFNPIIQKNFMLCINILYDYKVWEKNSYVEEQSYVKKHKDIILEVLWYTSSLT